MIATATTNYGPFDSSTCRNVSKREVKKEVTNKLIIINMIETALLRARADCAAEGIYFFLHFIVIECCNWRMIVFVDLDI